MDGTLFRTETVDVKALNDALVRNGFAPKTEEEMLSVIGHKLKDIFNFLTSSDDKSIMEQFAKDVIYFEQQYIEQYGKLYDGVIPMLNDLKKKGYTLCICSNGGKEYITSIVEKFNMAGYFEDIRYSVDGISKSKAVGLLKEKHDFETFIMIGDRMSDIEAAYDNDGISIGVSYGFGKDEVLKANYIAKNIEEVKNTIVSIFES
jgi:HAD superfamily hydrolase (TIGR01549 family)